MRSEAQEESLRKPLGDALMTSPVIKRSIVINGQKTSVSLEDAFWSGLKEIAHGQQASLAHVVAEIDKARQGNLSSAIRLFVLDRVRAGGTSGPAMLSSHDRKGRRTRRPSPATNLIV